MAHDHQPRDPRRIVVVGPCASGKSTLVAGLRRFAYDAIVCGQEHSEIATLWRHTNPDAVFALDVDLATIRARRGADWPETIFREQRRRLAAATAAADLVLDTAALDADEILARALAWLAATAPSGPVAEQRDSLQPREP